MYNLAPLISLDWKYIIGLITIISKIQVVEANVPLGFLVIKGWVHVALHLMKQVQIVHQLVKDIATTTLNKDGAIGVGVWIDGASGSLTADVASEGYSHPPARRFGEEGPREGRHPLRARSSLGARRSHGAFHSRIRGPASHRSGTQHQSHGRVLGESAVAEDGEQIRLAGVGTEAGVPVVLLGGREEADESGGRVGRPGRREDGERRRRRSGEDGRGGGGGGGGGESFHGDGLFVAEGAAEFCFCG